MDSVTQFALGAAIGELTMGRKIANRAILWGGICGTLPDLDVFVPFGGAVEAFTYHRSASHSLIVLTALTPVIVWLAVKINPDTRKHLKSWFLLVFLALCTHPILDCFTVYGTQIFWPISETPVAWSSIFIIDPMFTVPLIIGLATALLVSRLNPVGHKANSIGLLISVAYLAWTLVGQNHVANIAARSLKNDGISYSKLLINPTPFNSVLWRVLVMSEDGYREGFYSLFDNQRKIRMQRYPKNHELVAPIRDHWPVERLKWFTRGFYSASLEGASIMMTDLRMGLEPYYVFRFKVGERNGRHTAPSKNERRIQRRAWDMLPKIWKRIWDDGINIVNPG